VINVDKLAGKMREMKMNQKALAAAIGCSPNSISNKMVGKSDFTVIEANKIALALKMTTEEYVAIFFYSEVV